LLVCECQVTLTSKLSNVQLDAHTPITELCFWIRFFQSPNQPRNTTVLSS